MESWVCRMKQDLHEITDNAINEWSKLITQLGISEDDSITEWIDSYKEHIQDLTIELSDDLIAKRTHLLNNIEVLLKRSETLCKELEVKMPNFGAKNSGLYIEHKELLDYVEKLQKKWDTRMVEVKALLEEQSDLCTTLEQNPLDIVADASLPSTLEVDNLRQYIRDLEQEKYERSEKFISLKCECVDLAKKLSRRPKRSFERSVINGNDISFVVSKSNLEQLEKFHHNLTADYNTLSQNISKAQRQLKGLWKFLNEDSDFCKAFMEKHNEISNQTLRTFESEVSRCEERLKSEKEVYIKRMRHNIGELWEKCLYSDSERNQFQSIAFDVDTDDLLEFYRFELQALNHYYDENKELIKLITTRMDLVSRMLELEEKANNPDRLKNRGGQLLIEEKERKSVPIKLSKIEEKILDMATMYKINNGKDFTCWGESIVEVIANSHLVQEQTKKLKLSARKQQRILTPSNREIMTPRSCQVPNASSSALKVANQLFSKRRAQTSTKEDKSGRGGIPKIRLNGKTICKSKISFSTEKKKRMDKYRRISKILKKNNVSVWAEYNDFKTRIPARSTISMPNVCTSPLGIPLPETPSRLT